MMNSEAEEWFSQAKYDYATAEAMYDSQRYVYVVFMCHLSLEKVFKGLIVARNKDVPPKTHNLLKLAELSKVELTKEQIEFISILNTAAISTRYPEMLQRAIVKYPSHVAMEYLIKTKEVLSCLQKGPN